MGDSSRRYRNLGKLFLMILIVPAIFIALLMCDSSAIRMRRIKSAADLEAIFLAHEAEFRRLAESIDRADGLRWIAMEEDELSTDERWKKQSVGEFYFQSTEPLSTEVCADLEQSAALLWKHVSMNQISVRNNSSYVAFWYASDFAQSAVLYYSASGEEPDESDFLERLQIDENWYAVILG